MGQLFQGASGKIAALRAKSAEQGGQAHDRGAAGRARLDRGQARSPRADLGLVRSAQGGALASLKKLPAKKKLAVGAGAAVVMATVLALALKPSAEPPGAAAAGEPTTVSVQGVASGAPRRRGSPRRSDGSGSARFSRQRRQRQRAALRTHADGHARARAARSRAGGRSRGARRGQGQRQGRQRRGRRRVRRRVRALEHDVGEEQEDGQERQDRQGAKKLRRASAPKTSPAWGRGKMHLPTIHRLRLDDAGAEIRGVNEPTGFTVLIPGRKVMEKGAGLAKRDPRIARVRTTNTPGGAQVRIEFKDGMPAYRVRLRKDYIEFLISADDRQPEVSQQSR